MKCAAVAGDYGHISTASIPIIPNGSCLKYRLIDGRIVAAEKDCQCVTHDGPHWVHQDDLWKSRNREFLSNETVLGGMAHAKEDAARTVAQTIIDEKLRKGYQIPTPFAQEAVEAAEVPRSTAIRSANANLLQMLRLRNPRPTTVLCSDAAGASSTDTGGPP